MSFVKVPIPVGGGLVFMCPVHESWDRTLCNRIKLLRSCIRLLWIVFVFRCYYGYTPRTILFTLEQMVPAGSRDKFLEERNCTC
jgi:hypothetical protein